jgi:chromosome transmission fidelity protein 4
MADGDEDKDEDEDGSSETRKLEQQFMLHNVKAAQLRDLVEATSSSHSQRSQLSRLELEIDKTLLQLLAVECREGEERGMRALEMVQLMRDRTGRMMEAAGRVAERYGRTILGEKIREVGEKRIEGLEDDDFP